MTPDQIEALTTARQLVEVGIPVFTAVPALDDTGRWDPHGGHNGCGYWLPGGWQQSWPDPAAVEHWRPGMALCAVMGHGLDALDVDPRNGGDLSALNGYLPTSYGVATTPSGGMHSLIRSLGVRKDEAAPGIDLQAGDSNGEGRGFIFIAPTLRASKLDGRVTPYRWLRPFDAALYARAAEDMSGRGLAEMLAAKSSGPGDPDVDDFMAAGPWANIEETLSKGRNNGVARLAQALRGRGGWRVDDAIRYMYAEVWPLIDQEQSGHPFLADEFEETIQAQWRQYPDGEVDREQKAMQPPTPTQPPDPSRYFRKPGGFQAATLAADVVSLGPLAEGVDDRVWKYGAGVWRPAKSIVRDRVTFLLGELYRRGHVGSVEDIVRSRVGGIDCEPVEQVVNFRNGLLDWREGQLYAHTERVLSTVQLAVNFDAEASCPAFERFLAEVVPADMVETMWELIGYLMYSGNPLHKAVMLVGKGRNGKGTFIRVMKSLLGSHNITASSLHDLVNTRFTTASLFGKLANLSGDIDGTFLESTATLKAITGGDTISAEHKGRDRFDFMPWAVPVFSANKIPASADTTAGYLSRWLVIPFPNNFSGREDPHLDEKLTTPEELAGIAAHGIQALRRLMERGRFAETESGRAAKDDFVRRVDQVRTWINDCAELHPDLPFVPRTELYEAYKRWCARDGHRPVRASEFYDRLEAAGAHPTAYLGKRGFKGIRIIDEGWVGPFPMGPVPAPDPPTPPRDPETPDSTRSGAGTVTAELHQTETGADQEKQPSKIAFGADGAGRPNLPPARTRARSGMGRPAPSAPRSSRGAEKRAEARRTAIAEAAGSEVPLPALVTRSTEPRSIDLDQAETLVTGLEALTVDVEHTGYPIGHRHYELRTIQLGTDVFAIDLDAADAAQRDLVRRALAAAPRLHAHSATADLVPLVWEGLVDLDAWDRMHDTVIPAKLADPASTGADPDLKKLAGTVLGEQATAPDADKSRAALFKAGRWLTETKVTTPIERSGWAQVDPACSTMVRYAASDVLDTAALAKRLPQVPPEVYERERIAQRMTARIAHHGIRIDGERVAWLLAERSAARDAAAERVRVFDIDNPGSNKQVAERLVELGADLPRTAKGNVSVAEGVLDPLRETPGPVGELVVAVLDHRDHDTAIGTFLEPYQQLVDHGDGRARPTVYTLGTDTGRMSCVRPNLQQVPRAGGIRACFTADPGSLLISADFSGVEVRVAAALSGDRNLTRMIAEGIDLHWQIAYQVFGPQATKADRYMVKRGVFGRIYGGGIETLARQVGCPESTMAAAVATLDAMLPELAEWSRMVREGVKAGRTQMPTHSGRVIHLPREFPHKAPNYCIQGTARELLVDALVRWQGTRWDRAVLLPVHDELVVQVPEDDAEEATKTLVDVMETEVAGVRIAAEASEPSFEWKDAE